MTPWRACHGGQNTCFDCDARDADQRDDYIHVDMDIDSVLRELFVPLVAMGHCRRFLENTFSLLGSLAFLIASCLLYAGNFTRDRLMGRIREQAVFVSAPDVDHLGDGHGRADHYQCQYAFALLFMLQQHCSYQRSRLW